MRVTVEDSSGKVVIEDGAVKGGESPDLEGWDGTSIAAKVIKGAPERRYTLQVAYPANKADAVVAADGHRDFAQSNAVEDAAWAFLSKSPQVGMHHQPNTEGAGTVVESYIYRGPDWHLVAKNGAEHVITAGDWLVGIVWKADIWPQIASGALSGVSMQGSAVRRRPSKEALAQLRK